MGQAGVGGGRPGRVFGSGRGLYLLGRGAAREAQVAGLERRNRRVKSRIGPRAVHGRVVAWVIAEPRAGDGRRRRGQRELDGAGAAGAAGAAADESRGGGRDREEAAQSGSESHGYSPTFREPE